MPISQLIEFCDELHNRPNRCESCPNDTCQNSCTACLDLIHRVTTNDRTYNCENIIYCYTCKYLYRYSTEIEILFNKYANAFRNVKEARTWSIGCGPCSELFGLYNFKISNHLEFAINYKGFDLNTLWRPVHDCIKQMKQFEASFFYEDIFKYSKQTNEKPNIIILNYVISDILRTNRGYINRFIKELCGFINEISKCALIINDINLGQNDKEPRYYYNTIIREIRKESSIIHEGHFHFVNSQRSYCRYGQQHNNNRVPIIPPENISKTYTPWLECRSAQLFTVKRPKQ